MTLIVTTHRQRGSALLIVFVFAAILAIMLFRELPVVVFEARRAKEQVLIDRGNEYSRAVQLYQRKLHQFPPNLDALENTNRTRFLRKKFKDPFTDKTDWRLLHAGPAGTLIDSKIKSAQNVTGAGNSPFGSIQSNFGSQTSPQNTPSGPSAASSMPDNPNGTIGVIAGGPPRTQTRAGTNGSATAPSPDPSLAAGASDLDPAAATAGQANPAQPNSAVAGLLNNPNPQTPPPGSQSGASNTPGNTFSNASGNPNSPFGGSSFGNNSFGNNRSGSNNSGNTFGNNSSGFGTTSNSGNSNSGRIQSGGLAGVASKLERHSIKLVNDQQDYSMWEFYYDPTKDPMLNAAGAALAGTNGQQPVPGNQNSSFGNTNSAFGNTSTSSNGNSAFGNTGTSNTGSSGFGSSSTSNTGNSGFGNFGSGLSGMNNSSSSGTTTNPTTSPSATGSQQQSFPPP